MTAELHTMLLCLSLITAPACGLLHAKKQGRGHRAGMLHLLGFTVLLLLSVLLNAALFVQYHNLIVTLCILYAGVLFLVFQIRRILLILKTAARLLLYPWYLLLYGLVHWSFQGVPPVRLPKFPPATLPHEEGQEAVPFQFLLQFLSTSSLALSAGIVLLLVPLLLKTSGVASLMYRNVTVLTTLLSLISLSGAALFLLRPAHAVQSSPEQEKTRRLLKRIHNR